MDISINALFKKQIFCPVTDDKNEVNVYMNVVSLFCLYNVDGKYKLTLATYVRECQRLWSFIRTFDVYMATRQMQCDWQFYISRVFVIS